MLWWMQSQGGRFWHAYADGAPARDFDGGRKRQMVCGRWRGMGLALRDYAEPQGPVCMDCDELAATYHATPLKAS